MQRITHHQTGVVFHSGNGISRLISFNQNSGKVLWRYKIDTISNVKHPCIYLGQDASGNDYVIHNHYHYGQAFIDTFHGFAQGQTVFLSTEKCINTLEQVVKIALNQVKNAEPYHFFTNNCQTTVSKACNNTSESEDVNNWIGRILIGGVLLLRIAGLSASMTSK